MSIHVISDRVITTSTFSEEAKKIAKNDTDHSIILIDGF